MSKFFVVIVFLFLGSCAINDTNYKYLTGEQHKHFVDFNPETFDGKVVNKPDSFYVQEISPIQLKSLIGKHKYTCVFLWPTWCSAESCTNLKHYEDLETRYLFYDLKIITVAIAYDYMEINNILKNTEYNSQLYVIKYQPRYGYKIGRTMDMFTVEFTGDSTLFRKRNAFFFYKDTTLIYSGLFCNEHVLDSLLKKN